MYICMGALLRATLNKTDHSFNSMSLPIVGHGGSLATEVRRVLFDIGISMVSTCIITL